jgi:hypothetical protein
MGAKKFTENERDELLTKFDGYLAQRAGQNRKLQENNKRIERWVKNNPETKKFREGMKGKYGIDPLVDTDKFDMTDESFNLYKLREALTAKMKEADAESAFPLFVVAGLMQNIIKMYQLADVSYKDWVTVTPTKLLETPAAALHGLSFPNEVGAQMPYPEVSDLLRRG